jgi:two-component system nitrate/nitrite response regulator NarL
MGTLLASQLTDREREVLRLLARGTTSPEISKRLHIAPNTVRTHIQSILAKLQVHSRLEAAAFAVRHGLVDVTDRATV